MATNMNMLGEQSRIPTPNGAFLPVGTYYLKAVQSSRTAMLFINIYIQGRRYPTV